MHLHESTHFTNKNISHVNVCSLNAFKLSLLEIWLCGDIGKHVEILCITEHHRVYDDLARITLQGFTLAASFCRKYRKSRGGACIYVRDGTQYSELPKIKDLSIPKIFEVCGINLSGSYIICAYRPKTVKDDNFINYLENALALVSRHRDRNIIICGDFNIDILVDSTESKEFISLLQSHCMKPFITEPTRITDHSRTCIDNIISNVDLNKSGVVELGLSDHTLQYASLNISVKKDNSKYYKLVRDLKETNLHKLSTQLLQMSWDEVYNEKDYNKCFDYFHDKLTEAFEICCPLIKVRGDTNKNNKNWLTPGIKKSCETKRDLFIKSKVTKCETDSTHYKRYSTLLGQVIQLAKQKYNEKIIINSNDKVKATWKLINTHISGKKHLETRDYTGLTNNTNSKVAFNNQDAANIFNTYFINTCTSKNVQSNLKLPRFNQSSMFVKPVDSFKLTKKIVSLKNKKSCGYDGMSSMVIKSIAKAIHDPLLFLINRSLSEGVFPDKLKKARVKPIHKSDDKLDVAKYRPISLLSIISKLFEKIMADQLRKFLCSEKILAKEQFGFQKDMSTIDAIFEMTDFIGEALDNNDNIITVLLDLSKAFDHVNHDALINILNRYGVRGIVSDWFVSYLSGRSQFVALPTIDESGVLREVESNCEEIKVGVPQGSILGPILFLLYVNDLPLHTSNKIIMFADDVSVFFKFSRGNHENLSNTINNSINGIIEWFDSLNLNTNVGKTKLIHFRNYNTQVPQLSIKIRDEEIESASYVKFLGIYTDSNLNWMRHVDKLVGKCSSFCYALRSLIKIASKKAALQAYFAFFQSRVLYGLAVWGGSVDINRIFILQKRAIRILNNIGSSMESCRESFRELKIHTITALYVIELCKLTRRYPLKFPQKKPGLSERLNERNKGYLEVPHCRTASYTRATKLTAIKVYNSLPLSIKILTGKGFITGLKDYLLTVSPYNLDEFYNFKNN